jgi:hypothetical protein
MTYHFLKNALASSIACSGAGHMMLPSSALRVSTAQYSGSFSRIFFDFGGGEDDKAFRFIPAVACLCTVNGSSQRGGLDPLRVSRAILRIETRVSRLLALSFSIDSTLIHAGVVEQWQHDSFKFCCHCVRPLRTSLVTSISYGSSFTMYSGTLKPSVITDVLYGAR